MDAQIEVVSQEEAKELETDLSNIKGRSDTLVIKDDASYQMGTDTLTWIQSALKRCEDRRKFFVKPLNEHVSRINLFFKNYSTPLNGFKSSISTKMIIFRQERETARLKEEKRLLKLQEKKNKNLEKRGQEPLPFASIPEAQKTTFSETGAVTAKKIWTWKIKNVNQIQREYLTVDEKKINGLVRAGVREIKGIKIFQKETIAVK